MRLALWQCEQHPAAVAGNLERLGRLAIEAREAGVELLVCPEMFLTGYNLDAETLQRVAEPADGPSAQAVAAIARETGIAIVWGFAERGAAGGAIFNSVRAVDANGAHLATYRKTHLYGELDRARFRGADGAPAVFDLGGWRIGLLICYDAEFPEAVRGLALLGAELVVVPTANMQGFDAVPNLLVPARAYENQMVVAYANCCGSEHGLVYGGLSTVAGADGRLLAQAGASPQLLTVDIGMPVDAPARLPYLLDRRPDTYRSLLASAPDSERQSARIAELERELERLRADVAPVREFGRRHRAIFDSAIDVALIAIDRDGRVTDWNSGAAAILGWSAAEICGQPVARIFTPEDRATDRPATEMSGALETGHATDERWHLKKDGSRFWASGEMLPLRDPDGTQLGYLKVLSDNTLQKEIDEKQRADAEFQRSVLAASGDCIKVLDLDGTLLFMSEGGQRVMEVSDYNAIQGCLWPDFWQREGHDKAKAAVAAARAGGTGQFIGGANTMAGNPRLWDVQVTPILGTDGRPERLLSVSRDITESRRVEDALREAQSLNSLILGSARDCIVVLDLEGHNLFISPGGIEAMEVSDVQAVIGLSWLRVWQGADHEAARAAVAEARAGGIGRFQGFCPTHKGTPKWWDVVITPLPGLDGRPERLVSVGRDVSQRKQAEDRLALSEERLQLALGASGMVGIWDWDLRSDMIHSDANFARLYSVDADSAGQGAPVVEFFKHFHADDLPVFQAELARVFAARDEFKCEYRVVQRDGSDRWVMARGRLIDDVPGGRLRFAGASVDITALKLADARLHELNATLEQRVEERTRELEETHEQLRQSQKMEAVGQLTGGLAHDFNNLLAGITGSLELVQRRVSQGRLIEVDRYLTMGQEAVKRAASLTHRLLAFSRRQTHDPQPTEVNRLIAGMEDLLRRTVGPTVALEFVAAPDPWLTLIDPHQLENALLNLSINARDAMPAGGRLTIETANRWFDERAGREHNLIPGPYLALSVTDTGTGIAPDIVDRIFEPFFTTKPMGVGTGLGLSMVYGFALQSGGRVRAGSEPGRGTTMSIYLPRLPGPVSPTEPTPVDALPRASSNGETVLVIDDEETVRLVVTEVLRELGYRALEAADAATGLALLRASRPVDLLVTDIGLRGGLNGLQVADAARVLCPSIKVLFITGYDDDAALGSRLLPTGMQVLTKPFAMEVLASRIEGLLAASA